MSRSVKVIKRPLITEKSTLLSEVGNRYAFEVALDANKHEIRDAVQGLFDVQVRRVHTMVMPGQQKRTVRGYVRQPNWKKAIVTLKDGQKIDFFQTK